MQWNHIYHILITLLFMLLSFNGFVVYLLQNIIYFLSNKNLIFSCNLTHFIRIKRAKNHHIVPLVFSDDMMNCLDINSIFKLYS